jgi:DhnA family fructose-bisphosphate aldolase class Ia
LGLLILAADHRARGVMTIERYADYVAACTAALPECDGILATVQPMRDLARSGALTSAHATYLSVNRTGLAGSVFELDDRLVASVARAAADGWTGIKHMTRIDMTSPHTAGALELLGQVLLEAADAGLDALIEALPWKDGRMDLDVSAIVHAAVIAHDMGAPLLKVPIPAAANRPDRVAGVRRIVESVGVPVLFLGGAHTDLDAVADAMAGGAAGMAFGRTIFQDPDPSAAARRIAEVVHG